MAISGNFSKATMTAASTTTVSTIVAYKNINNNDATVRQPPVGAWRMNVR
jgi:hypothetical protein